jgi:hypothetical protein
MSTIFSRLSQLPHTFTEKDGSQVHASDCLRCYLERDVQSIYYFLRNQTQHIMRSVEDIIGERKDEPPTTTKS